MLASQNDGFLKKIGLFLLTFLLDLFVTLFFWGGGFILMYYNEWLGVGVFFMGVFFSRKLINYIENYIGVACCLQNKNKHNLIHFDCTFFLKNRTEQGNTLSSSSKQHHVKTRRLPSKLQRRGKYRR